MVFLFIINYLSFSFSFCVQHEKLTKKVLKEGVDKLFHLCLSCHTKTPACTYDVITNAPTINTITFTPVHHEFHNLLQYIVNFITKYTVIQLLYHVNVNVNKCLTCNVFIHLLGEGKDRLIYTICLYASMQ